MSEYIKVSSYHPVVLCVSLCCSNMQIKFHSTYYTRKYFWYQFAIHVTQNAQELLPSDALNIDTKWMNAYNLIFPI